MRYLKDALYFFQIFLSLNISARSDSRLRKGLVFGRAWSPSRFSTRFFSFWFGKYNYNNILLHAKNVSISDKIPLKDLGTFNFTRYLENKLLQRVSEIMNLPFSAFSGYVTSGATEANIYAMWIAREWGGSILRAQNNGGFISWLIPNNAHYSIKKALKLLDIENHPHHKIVDIEIDSLGRARGDQIIEHITVMRQKDNHPIIILQTVMTTEFGSIDPVKDVDAFLNNSKFENIFFHIDAAFSGLLLPFIDEYKNVFSLLSLNSISIDFHKTMGGPVGCGSIIFRAGFEKYISLDVPYLGGNVDQTLSGSRSGLNVIEAYSILALYDAGSMQKEIANARGKTSFLAEKISKIHFIELLYPPRLNYIVFSLCNVSKEKEGRIRCILKSYSITSSSVIINGEMRDLFKIIVRKDHSIRNIRKLIFSLTSVS